MMIVNLYEAKTQLSRLVDQAASGQDVVIARNGKPVARLTGISEPKPVRYGVLKGKVTVADDFEAPLPDSVIEGFEGR
jgi:prevent-host-death family protein